MLKKSILLMTRLMLCGCSQQPTSPADTPTSSVAPTIESAVEPTTSIIATETPAATVQTSQSLPLVSVGIFTNTTDPTEYCIITVNIDDGTNYNSIDMQPMYDFVNTHLDLIEFYDYSNKYEDINGEMLVAMGFTPQTLKGYNISYYYYYYKIDPSITDDFLAAVHEAPAKYGTRIEEGNPIEVNYVEQSIEFEPVDSINRPITPLPFAFNKDGWDYYMVNEDEKLYLKIIDTVNYDVFTIGSQGNLFGMFYQGDVSIDCLYGWYISDSAFTHHGESGGFSAAIAQLSDNLRIESFFMGGLPLVSNETVNQEVNSFSYDNIQLEVVE